MTETEKILEQFANALECHGVTDYVIALRDPDGFQDCTKFQGSIYWRLGLGVDLAAQASAAAMEARDGGK